MATMRAVQLVRTGSPSTAFEIATLPIPTPKVGQVLIRIKAFGLNRSEYFTRKTGSAPMGPVKMPRVLGVEAVGYVEEAPGHETEFPKGSIAMTAGGGMGILFDGGYAQYTCVTKDNVRLAPASAEKLGWQVLGALPIMMQTAHGVLHRSLNLKANEKLLIRGGTTSVGLTAASLAKAAGATVFATTRKSDTATHELLTSLGVDHIIVDEGSGIKDKVLEKSETGVDKILELVGGTTLADSMACLKQGGTCCFCGGVGESFGVANFNPFVHIGFFRFLTSYGEMTFKASNFPLDDVLNLLHEGKLKLPLAKSFKLDEIVQAHELMESNEGNGKIVVLVD